MLDEAELYEGPGFGVLEWGHRFARQVDFVHLACGFLCQKKS